MNILDGKRHGTYAAYLKPALARGNVTAEVNALAARLVFEGDRCVGVEYLKDGKTTTVRADREVIVSAGAIQSPKLLMLSGIGQPEQLPSIRHSRSAWNCRASARTSRTTRS